MRAHVRHVVMLLGLGVLALALSLGWYWVGQSPSAALRPMVADFGRVYVSPDVQRLADWVLANNDNEHKAFVLIDKVSARLYVVDRFGQLLGVTPVLLGSALGDVSAPGIGQVAIADVKPAQRITPAGRFVAERGHNLKGEDVVWLDYDAAVSIHRVVTSNSSERRLERLKSITADDNRISYGCINVAPQFYEDFIRPLFTSDRAVIYVLPDRANFRDAVFAP